MRFPNLGTGLHSREKINWKNSVEWYRRSIENSDDIEDDRSDTSPTIHALVNEPIYTVLAKIAELYQSGGNGLEMNLNASVSFFNQAGEMAMAHGKGRLSTRYYMLAETISAELE